MAWVGWWEKFFDVEFRYVLPLLGIDNERGECRRMDDAGGGRKVFPPRLSSVGSDPDKAAAAAVRRTKEESRMLLDPEEKREKFPPF